MLIVNKRGRKQDWAGKRVEPRCKPRKAWANPWGLIHPVSRVPCQTKKPLCLSSPFCSVLPFLLAVRAWAHEERDLGQGDILQWSDRAAHWRLSGDDTPWPGLHHSQRRRECQVSKVPKTLYPKAPKHAQKSVRALYASGKCKWKPQWDVTACSSEWQKLKRLIPRGVEELKQRNGLNAHLLLVAMYVCGSLCKTVCHFKLLNLTLCIGSNPALSTYRYLSSRKACIYAPIDMYKYVHRSSFSNSPKLEVTKILIW